MKNIAISIALLMLIIMSCGSKRSVEENIGAEISTNRSLNLSEDNADTSINDIENTKNHGPENNDEETIDLGELFSAMREANRMSEDDTFNMSPGLNLFMDDKTVQLKETTALGKYWKPLMDSARQAFLAINPDYAGTIKDKEQFYRDGHRGLVYLPLGESSFAEEVVNVQKGRILNEDLCNQPELMKGSPIKNNENCNGAYSLGIGGSAVLRFTNNALVDIGGVDLYVFEKFLEAEPTQLEISEDGVNWIDIGKIDGGKATIDIKDFVEPDQIFYYVRLTDLEKNINHGATPGADIDAIASVGSVLRFTLNSSILFDFNSHTLKETPAVSDELQRLYEELENIGAARIIIEGHTDNLGAPEYNLKLSSERANEVKSRLKDITGNKPVRYSTKGLGDKRPVDTNETEEGRANNRRVDILVIPAK